MRDNHDVVRNVRGAFTPHKLRCVKLVRAFYISTKEIGKVYGRNRQILGSVQFKRWIGQ